ncbi:MAG: hypothetical protein UV60_C0011G0014 [Parcubacteria group bacterium GW2011_GWA2_43_11]|nr:MAG: hypothetical protein UV60_C0011G0014 [Parcubacteria group bacterium GW2011_GWA2_43_11]
MTKLTQKFAQNESLNMFLFNKKTRNIIKYMWAVMAVLIVLSMIFAYSGFTSLTQTTANQQQIEIPPEVQAQLDLQKNGSTTVNGKVTTPEEQAVLDAINEGRLDINSTTTSTGTPQAEQPVSNTPPAETLKLEI